MAETTFDPKRPTAGALPVLPSREGGSPVADRICVLSSDARAVLAALGVAEQPLASAVKTLDEIVESSGVIVAILDDDVLGREPRRAVERLLRRVPAARFVFLNKTRHPARARDLVAFGAVLSLPIVGERLNLAVQHALTLGTMTARMDGLRKSGEFPISTGGPPSARGGR